MKNSWKRFVCLLLCLIFILSTVSTTAEEIMQSEANIDIKIGEQPIIESEDRTPVSDITPLPEPENTDLPTEMPNLPERSEPDIDFLPETSELPIEEDVVDLPILGEEETDGISSEFTDEDVQIEDEDEPTTGIVDFYALQEAILPVSDFVIEGNKLIAYQGSDSKITTPNDVTIIGASAFANCETITSITISDSVTCIEENAFLGCKSLAFLHVPASVIEIAELDSLLIASPQVQIEVSSGSYAEEFCIAHNIAYTCFDAENTETLQPTAIVPASEKLTIGIQEKVSIAAWTLLPEGAQDSMTYAVQSTKIASVNADGIVTGKRTGSTKIYLTSGTGLTATIQLNVMKSPTSITLSTDRKELGQGETAKLSYTLSKKSAGTVTFESLNPEIATVDANGVVTAIALGNATIRATTYNKKVKTIDLKIGAAPSEVIPNQTEVKIGARDSWTLAYRLNEGAAGAVAFVSSDETVATVNSEGKINALAQGEAEITITAYNGVSSICKVIVMPEPTAFELKAERTTLGINEKLQLLPSIQPEGTMGTIQYKSSKTKIATVSSDGIVTAKRAGTATITASTYNGLTTTVKLTVKRAPSTVSISAPRKTLGQGETMKLGYALSKNSAGAVTFESLNPEIATVDANGVVTAIAPGSATIRATTYNKKSKTIDLKIGVAPSEVIPNQTEVKIGARDSWTLSYRLNEGAAGTVAFVSSDETVATVNSEGKINALAQGEAEITITAYNGVSGICKVIVMPEPTAFELKAERTTLGINEKLQLMPSIQPEGTMGTIQYKSSKTKIATVSSDGIVTAKRAGTVTITASTYNGLTATVKLTVKRAPSTVSISAPRKTLGQGETMKLGYALSKNSAGAVTFESLNPELATIRADGLLTALQPGAATIYAKSFNGKTAKLDVNVVAAPESVIPAQTDVCIGCGDHWKLGYAFNDGAAGSVFFASLDEHIATVDENGMIYAKSEGNTQIQLTAHNGVSAFCNVAVAAAPTAIKIIAEKTELGVQESMKLKAEISPEGTVGTLNWKSSKSSVATVDDEGNVKTKRAGTTYITVSTYNGIEASIKLTVKKAPTSVNIQMARKILGVGESMQLGYTLSKGSTGTVTFESLNPTLLEVTPQGEVKALASGTAIIRATTHNGKKRTASIEIKNAPDALYLSESTCTLGIGENYKLSYRLNDGSAGAITFESSDPMIAGIDSSGNIQAYAVGTVEVHARTYNGVGDTCTLNILPAPSGIDLSMQRSTFGVKEVVQLTPTVLPEGSAGTLKYKSSKSSVVAVSSSGILTAKKVGSATITISTYNGISKSFKVKVVKAATAIKISAERTRLSVGESMVFSAKLTGTGSYAFSSSNPDILSIDPLSGHAIAHATGCVDVIAKTHNGKTDKIEVTVLPAPTEIHISPSDIVIGRGDTTMLHAEFAGEGAGTYTFESSEEGIVTIDENGTLRAVEKGDAVITVRAYNGIYDTASVHVADPISEITLKELEKDDAGHYVLSLNWGESYQLELDKEIYSGIGCDYIPANNVISVTDDGLITARRKGICMLTIIAYSGATATVEISVEGIGNTSGEANVIMHAMGAVNGKHYSNSREAFLQNYAKGNRLFEVDLQYTSDQELVLWHNWKSNQINSSVKAGYIPTEKEFADMQIFDRYDSLTYRDLLALMDSYPDTLFFIDSKKTKANDVRNQFKKMVSVARETGHAGALDRMVIMIYNQDMYSIVNAIYPFKNYVLMGYKYFSKAPTTAEVRKAMEFCVAHNISMISMWDYWWKSDFQNLAEEYGLIVNLHTIDSVSDARKYVSQGVKLITSNIISEGTL